MAPEQGRRAGCNSRFLNGVLSCVAQRVRLFGLAQYDVRAIPKAPPDDANEDDGRLSDARLAALTQLLLESESTSAK